MHNLKSPVSEVVDNLADIIPTITDIGGAQRKFDPSKHYLLPFPQTEMDINTNLDQNPGYN